MKTPRRYAETGPLRKLWRALNEIRDYAVSVHVLRQSKNVRVKHTSQGTLLDVTATQEVSGGGDSLPVWL